MEKEQQPETEKVVLEAEELPKAMVRRVVKDSLSQCSPADINIHKDALIAFTESARIFIHYLSATANDICKETKRQTINADDVLKAIEEIEFSEFIGPLKASLTEFRKKNAGKKAVTTPTKEEKNKRKAEEEPSKKGKSNSSKTAKSESSKKGKSDASKDKGKTSSKDKSETSKDKNIQDKGD